MNMRHDSFATVRLTPEQVDKETGKAVNAMNPTNNNQAPRMVKTAMVLAAGLGERMRPLTDDRPKPLVEVVGKTLIDRIFDRLRDAGISDIVVNTHYRGDQLQAHLNARDGDARIRFSDEADELLNTGGGVQKALPMLGSDPFLAINSDALWRDGTGNTLRGLSDAFDPDRMDVLLLMAPVVSAIGYSGRGDFSMDQVGRLKRRAEGGVAPFVYAGIQILHPRLFEGAPGGAYSLNLLYDRALEAGRLFGHRHDGQWIHVGTPDAVLLAEQELEG